VRLDRLRGVEPSGGGVDHDERGLLLAEQLACLIGGPCDQKVETEALERRCSEVPQQL
jgi:hypothetical protein